ncbi:MAG: NAD(P)H-binding protein [Bryobacterales bacterium]|nr:NAD(P)H-binding protein [Bryobacterales bacterium]MDE0264217.1 NAD(P)H-binding protein [Bryobacterales bacterium]MDE0622249.1 NAD(P)H-binding protein [Bryobacterales bacterium]
MSRHALIIGCGFTARRTARTLLQAGWDVTATSRSPESLAALEAAGARLLRFDAAHDQCVQAAAEGASVLLSVPTFKLDGQLFEPTPSLVAGLRGRPRHLTYLSTTGVYGATRNVDERTPVSPQTERQQLRASAEDAVQSHGCSALVLRPAAIYGPGRGVHQAMREGRFQLPRDSSRLVSRIHVDDLATIVARALQQRVEGAYPVADECPATSAEVARYCAALLDLPVPEVVADDCLSETRRADRRVDGSAIRRLVGVPLRYPSFREGIPACIAVEQAG